MMPAPAAVARPGFAASTSTTSAPSELAAYAHEAPTMPEPTTISRNSPRPCHTCPAPTPAPRQHSTVSQVDDESVVSALEGNLVLVAEHVGGHVGDDDAPGGEPVPVGVEVGVAEVVGDVLVPVVGLCDEQVRTRGDLDERFGPGGVAGIGQRLARQVQAEQEGRGAAGVLTCPGADRHPGHGAGGPRVQFDRVDVETTQNRGGAGEHALHRVGEAAGDARRPGDGERCGAAGELAVEDKEGQPSEVVAVQVGDEHAGDLARVQSQAPEGAERGGPAVQEHRGVAARALQVDAGLETATAAEGVAAAGEGHGDGWAFAHQRLKPQFRTRVATGPVAVMSSPGVPSVTPIKVTPFWVASKSRQLPAAVVSPVLIPAAPG